MYDLLREEGQLYLEHSGILGQKWGVRNGPPYPLEEHTNAHKRAGFKESILKTRLKKKAEDKNIKTVKNAKKDKPTIDKKDKTSTRKARGKAATAAALVIAGIVIVGAARHPRLVKKGAKAVGRLLKHSGKNAKIAGRILKKNVKYSRKLARAMLRYS